MVKKEYSSNEVRIEPGSPCTGDGYGCDKCMDEHGKCLCVEGSQPWGCGAGQTPTCISNEELEKKKAEENNPHN